MDYKHTLNLPKTDFPMRANLPVREPEMLARWEEMRIYERLQQANAGKPRFVLHDGPPYANNNIHLGQALEGLTRHASTHAAGVVVTPRPLTEYLPLYVDPKSAGQVTQS